MKKSALFSILLMVLIFSANLYAQEEEEEKWRNFEVSMYGGLTKSSNIDWYDSLASKTGFHFGGAGGYYFTDRICLGVYFTYSQMGLEEPSSLDLAGLNYKMYNIGLYGKYAFTGESNLEPYIKFSAGANFPKFSTWVGEFRTRMREISYDPGFSGGGYLGLMYYTSDYGAIFIEAGYHMDMLQYNEGTYDNVTYVIPEDVKYAEVRAGIVVFFGPE